MIREELSKPPAIAVVEFNPWMFSGTDQLLETFFWEVGAQFRTRRDRLSELADDIEAYGEVVAPLRLLPVIGVWVERARTVAKALKKAVKRREGGVLAKREAFVHESAAALKAKGVELEQEPAMIYREDQGLFGPVGMEEWMAFFRDPDRNVLAFVSQVHSKD